MNYDIKAYIKRENEASGVEIHSLWPGMWLLKSENVTAYGKPKNIVTESYAETDGLKVWLPATLAREATDVTLTMCFLDEGGDRYAQYDSFVAYISNHVFQWWDTVRRRRERLLLTEKTEPNENFHGGIPYLEAKFKFKNVDGKAESVAGYWTFAWSEQLCVKVEGLNNGYARRKKLTFTREDDESKDFTVTAAFTYGGTTYPLVNDSTFAAMDAEDYTARLAAFCDYATAWMESHYTDFAGMVSSVGTGALVSAPVSCPVQ